MEKFEVPDQISADLVTPEESALAELIGKAEQADRESYDGAFVSSSEVPKLAEISDEWVMSERCLEDPEYLKFLSSLEQEYIEPSLEKGPKLLKDVAILSIDYEGFTRFARRLTETVDYSKYASREMAKHMSLGLNEARRLVGAYGGMMDGVFGDGTSAIFYGDKAVAKAVLAAQAIEEKIKTLQDISVRGVEAPWKVRFGISFGDAMLVSYGDNERRADLTGSVVAQAEDLQKKAIPGKSSIVLSESAQGKLSSESEVSFSEDLNAYAVGKLDKKDKEIDLTEGGMQAPQEPEEIRRWAAFREKHFSQTRRKEIRNQYFREQEPDPDMLPISTLFIRLKGLDMSGENFEQTNSYMTSIFEIANNFRGKVDKVHHDSVMINFVAGDHELNSAMAAVRIREEIETLRQQFDDSKLDPKMSCTKGDAFLLVVGGNRTVYGESVNRASRLLYANNPGGGLVVDESTFLKINRARVDAEALRPVVLKDYEDKPINIYLIKNIEQITFRHVDVEKVVGLERETKLLNQYYDEAKAEGRVVAVKGPSGAGKTLLVARFIHDKEEKGVKVIEGRAERSRQNISFAVWRDILESAFVVQNVADKERRGAIVEEHFRVNGLSDVYGDKLALFNAVLDTKFSETDATRYLSTDEREEKRAELIAETLKSFASLNQPAIVFLEDVHFFDKDSAQLAAKVMPKLEQNSCLEVLTTWIEEEGDERTERLMNFLKNLSHFREVPVESLPLYKEKYYDDIPAAREWWHQAKEKYLALASNIGIEFLPSDLDENDKNYEKKDKAYARFFINVARTSKGVPRHVLEILEYFTLYKGRGKDYFREKELSVDGESKVFYALGETRIGDEDLFGEEEISDIYKIEQQKLENLGGDSKAILRDASVVGMVFDEKVLQHISGLSGERIQRALRNAKVARMVRSLGEGEWEFIHGVTQHAIYESIGKIRERQANHRLIAEYLVESTPDSLRNIVHHYRHSDDYLNALRYLDEYTEQLKKVHLWGTALDQIRYATNLGFESEKKEGVFEKIQERGWQVFDETKGFRTLRRLAPEERDWLVDGQAKRAFRAVSIWRASAGDRKKALAILESAKKVFTENHSSTEEAEPHDQIILARFHRELGKDKTYLALYDEAQADLDKAGELLDEVEAGLVSKDSLLSDYREMRADLYDALGWLNKRMRNYPKALECYQKGLPFSDNYETEFSLRNGLAFSYKDLGRPKKAQDTYAKLLELAERENDKGNLVVILNNSASLNARMGRLEEAEGLHRRAIELGEQISKTTSVYYSKGGLAFILRMKGEYEKAADLFRESSEFFGDRGSSYNANVSRAELAFCLIKSGELAEAEQIIDGLRNSKEALFRGRSYTLGAMMDIGREGYQVDEEILREFNRGVELLKESGKEDDLAFDLLYFGELEIENGRTEEGLTKVREAKDIYERIQDLSEMGKIEKILKRYPAGE